MIASSGGGIEPNDQVDPFVTSMPFGETDEFDLYNVEYDSATGGEKAVYLTNRSW